MTGQSYSIAFKIADVFSFFNDQLMLAPVGLDDSVTVFEV